MGHAGRHNDLHGSRIVDRDTWVLVTQVFELFKDSVVQNSRRQFKQESTINDPADWRQATATPS